jgi:hypothetical protein
MNTCFVLALVASLATAIINSLFEIPVTDDTYGVTVVISDWAQVGTVAILWYVANEEKTR